MIGFTFGKWPKYFRSFSSPSRREDVSGFPVSVFHETAGHIAVIASTDSFCYPRFNPSTKITIGILPLGYALEVLQERGKSKHIEWNVIAVMPSSNLKQDSEALRHVLRGTEDEQRENMYHLRWLDFIVLTKWVQTALLNNTYATAMKEEVALLEMSQQQQAVKFKERTRKHLSSLEQMTDDNAALQLEVAELRAEIKRLQRKLKPEDRSGYVYVVADVYRKGQYKIGRTKNPDNRIKTFNVKLPFPVEYVHIIEANDMYDLESELHARYRNKRVRGEWFDLDADDIAYLKSL